LIVRTNLQLVPLLLAVCTIPCMGATSQAADAVQNRDAQALRSLIAEHANINAPQADGTTALHWAAHWNDPDLVNLLIRAGADVKASNRYGATPLSEAAATGNAAREGVARCRRGCPDVNYARW